MEKIKLFFMKNELVFLLVALAILLTVVPVMVSAANTVLNIAGFAIMVVFVVYFVKRIFQHLKDISK